MLYKKGIATYTLKLPSSKELFRSIKNHFPEDYLNLLGCNFDENDVYAWPLNVIMRSGSTQNPLFHLLLIQFLGVSLQELLSSNFRINAFGNGPWPCLNPVCNDYLSDVIDEIDIRKKTRPPLSRVVGYFEHKSCGYIYSRHGPELSSEDRYKKSQVIAYGSVWENELKELWMDENLSTDDVGRKLGVTGQTIQNHALRLGLPFPKNEFSYLPQIQPKEKKKCGRKKKNDIEELRKKWLSLMEENPSAILFDLVKIDPSLYYSLISRDKEWLNDHKPKLKKPRIKDLPETIELDIKYSSEVDHIVSIELSKSEFPECITKAFLIRKLGISVKTLRNFPKTSEKIRSNVETTMQFGARKIKWATLYFKNSNLHPAMHEFLRFAKIQYKHEKMFVNELENAQKELGWNFRGRRKSP